MNYPVSHKSNICTHYICSISTFYLKHHFTHFSVMTLESQWAKKQHGIPGPFGGATGSCKEFQCSWNIAGDIQIRIAMEQIPHSKCAKKHHQKQTVRDAILIYLVPPKFEEAKRKNRMFVENCCVDLLLKPRCHLRCAYLCECLGPYQQRVGESHSWRSFKPSESDWINIDFYHQNPGIIDIT